MRYLFVLFYCCALTVNAQTHLCAASKQHAILQPFSKAASLSQQALMNEYDAVYHHLNLTVQRDTTYIQGSVRTFARVIVSAFDTFGFELYNSLTIDSIVRNGTQLTYQRSTHFVYCVLPDTLHFNDVIDLTIYYHGTPPKAANAAIGAGFTSATSQRWGNRATWSLSQPYSAYEWWPCKQSLQDKLDSSSVSITTSSENKAGSNGLLQRIDSLPGNLIRYNWVSHYPIDYYLISVAVAKYKEYISYAVVNGDSILIQDYIYDNPATYTTFKPVLDQTASMITSFSEHLIPYPFAGEKYGHAMAPFSGGMEHQTMTSLGIIDFGIVAHELAHQWFGDYVTCKTWKDIWLNEGFASYMEYLALEWLDPGKKAAHMNDVHSTILGNALGSIAFTDTTNVSRIFDSRLTYNKGAAFVHILRYEINNDTLFFGFLRHYLQQFAHRTASTADFKQLLEQYTGRDFTQVFTQWFYGQGYPIFNMRWNQNGHKLFIRSTETTAASATLLFKTPVDVLISTDQGDTLVRLYHDTLVEYVTLDINGTVSALTVDPNNWILNASYTNRDPMMGLTNEPSTHFGISLFPNPVNNELHVVTDQEFRGLIVRDMLGRDLIHSSKPSVVLDFLQSGAYICEIRTGPDNCINVVHFIKN